MNISRERENVLARRGLHASTGVVAQVPAIGVVAGGVFAESLDRLGSSGRGGALDVTRRVVGRECLMPKYTSSRKLSSLG